MTRALATTVGYVPYDPRGGSLEAGWLAAAHGCDVRVLGAGVTVNGAGFEALPALATLRAAVAPLVGVRWVVVEGPGGFLWAAVLRACGFSGGVTVLPYLNPRRWFDVACVAAYRASARAGDRVLVGSPRSARIYRALGVRVDVGEPYGVDCARFRPRPRGATATTLAALGLGPGPLLLFAGRAQRDKDLHRLVRAALRVRRRRPALQLVLAAHVVDEAYLAGLSPWLDAAHGVHVIVDPHPDRLAALYAAADVFVTAATSAFETFGRAPAEALASGTPAIAPRYDGFVDVLAQPGGTLVDVRISDDDVRVDEDALVGAIDDVLAAHPPRARIAAAARARFDRARTLGLLAHVAGRASPIRARRAVRPADVAWPASWRRRLADLDGARADVALTSLWRRGHATAVRDDARAVAAVRAALATDARTLAGAR